MRTINIGQFYGGLAGAVFWICLTIWYLYGWPRSLRRRTDRGDIDAFDGLPKLRKASLIGYFFLLIAIADAVGTLDYVGAVQTWVAIGLQFGVLISMFFVVRAIIRESRVARR
jgi:hypothetical protein